MSASQHMRRLGQPIAYFPELARKLGGVNASIFFSQLFYWMPKSNHPDGIYKTAAEIEAETGLTVQEQRTARKKLVDLGVLIETNRRIEHRLYFKLDLARFDALSLQHSGSEESTFAKSSSNIPEMQNQHSGSEESTFDEMQNQHSYKEQENTKKLQQETTAGEFGARAAHATPPADTASRCPAGEPESSTVTGESSAACPAKAKRKKPTAFDDWAALEALGVERKYYDGWMKARRLKKSVVPLTEAAFEGFLREAEKVGLSVPEAVQMCAEKSWAGINSKWECFQRAPQGHTFDHATGAMVGTGNVAVDLAQRQAARAADWLASLPTDAEGNLI